MKLFPLLAETFASLVTGKKVFALYHELFKDLKEENFTLLDLMHHYTSGMKVSVSQFVHDSIL